ncbi:MAG: hypothetical protein HC895_02415 [Leptolyngbyaceae cyanobacterium SM1_3_5]|nr:hypothetical protein [Leptolyngbyaceae cyanobacterium SM1_3_5]
MMIRIDGNPVLQIGNSQHESPERGVAIAKLQRLLRLHGVSGRLRLTASLALQRSGRFWIFSSSGTCRRLEL